MASYADQLALAAMDAEDEEEEDYIPQAKEEKEYERELLNNMTDKQKKKLEKKLKNAHKKERRVKRAWEQMQQDIIDQQNQELEKRKKIQLENQNIEKLSLEIAQKVIEEQDKKDTKKVRFAGKDFIVDDKGNIMQEEEKVQEKEKKEENKENQDELYHVREGFRYVNVLMDKIKQKTKQLNSLSKSKYDWKNYAKKEKIEQQLEQNRKGGYLQNQNFLQESKIKQKEYRKSKK